MPELSKEQKTFLQNLFPGDGAAFEPEQTAIYGTDAGRGFAQPLAVVRPETVDQVQKLLAWAKDEAMPIYPRARATNLVGDCVPDAGGVVVSCLRMNRILEVSPEDFVAVVEPGVVTSEFQAHVEAMGLFYPPDPASLRMSTLGGNVSTGAGGMRAVKYGVTREFVLGVEVVLPGGELVRFGGRTHKNVVGLDLARLFVGSEGTLGFLTKLILKLLPKPAETASLLAGYASLEDSMEAARSIFAAGILPVAMEFMSQEVLHCVAKIHDVPWAEKCEAALLLKLDGSPGALAADMERLRRVVQAANPVYQAEGMGSEGEEPLWEVRRLINPASFQVAPHKIADDVTVPRGSVGKALAGIREIGQRFGFPILTFGHLGDGNLHVNIMHDANVPGQRDKALKAKIAILDLVLGLTGSLSGEHGIGLDKHPYVGKQLSEQQRTLMRSVKAVFDPTNIMNPGKAY